MLVDIVVMGLAVFSAVFFMGIYLKLLGEKLEFKQWRASDLWVFGLITLCFAIVGVLTSDLANSMLAGLVTAAGAVFLLKIAPQP